MEVFLVIIGIVIWRVVYFVQTLDEANEGGKYIVSGARALSRWRVEFGDLYCSCDVFEACIASEFGDEAFVFSQYGIICEVCEKDGYMELRYLPYHDIRRISFSPKKHCCGKISITKKDGTRESYTVKKIKGNTLADICNQINRIGYPIPDYKGEREYRES